MKQELGSISSLLMSPSHKKHAASESVQYRSDSDEPKELASRLLVWFNHAGQMLWPSNSNLKNGRKAQWWGMGLICQGQGG